MESRCGRGRSERGIAEECRGREREHLRTISGLDLSHRVDGEAVDGPGRMWGSRLGALNEALLLALAGFRCLLGV